MTLHLRHRFGRLADTLPWPLSGDRQNLQGTGAGFEGGIGKKYYKQATVIIAVDSKPRKSKGKNTQRGRCRVLGPQELSSDETLTVSKAILRAGGLTGFAEGKNVKITRTSEAEAGEKSFIVNVSQIYEKGKLETDLPLQPGDLIFVPERMIRF